MKVLAIILLAGFSGAALAQDAPGSPAASQTTPTATDGTAPANGVYHVGGGVTPPRVVHTVNPEFSEQARKAKFSGHVELYLVVEENGTPSHIRVVRGVGMGLDEKAVEAVRQYKFTPAMRDGKPVKVDMYIDVNFQIFSKDK